MTPHWFGPAERPLFGMLHVPEGGTARAGVAVCPSFGTERVIAHWTLRAFAENLCRAGILVLSFDYDGTGDSAGLESDPGRAEAWQQSVRDALAELRRLGAPALGLAGLRLGAVLAGLVAAETDDVGALVLWDPVASGRSFLRQGAALREMSLGPQTAPEGAAELPCMVVPAGEVAGVSGLNLANAKAPLAQQVLVVEREGVSLPPKLAALLADAERTPAVGQAAMLDVPSPVSKPALATAAVAAEWLAKALPEEYAAVGAANDVPVTPAPGVTERSVRLGPNRLLAIEAVPRGPRSGPTVLMLNMAAEPHIGPSRLWVDLARTLAVTGVRSVRLDLASLGDSPERPGTPPLLVHAPRALAELQEAVVSALTDPAVGGRPGASSSDELVLVGVCSGANQAVEAGVLIGARGVVAVSYSPWVNVPGGLGIPADVQVVKDAVPEDAPDLEAAEAAPPPPPASPLRKLLALRYDPRVKELKHHVPPWGWQLLDRVGVRPSHTDRLALAVAAGVDTIVLVGDEDAPPYETSAMGAVARLNRSPSFRLVHDPGLDHAMQRAVARERVFGWVTAEVARWQQEMSR